MLVIVSFFKVLCLSFATITLCAVALSLCFAWMSTNPRYSPAKRDLYADRIYQAGNVAQWTLLAATVLALCWFSSYGIYRLFF